VKTTVLFLIIAFMAVVRLVLHLKPTTLESLDPVTRAKLTDSIDSLVSAGVVALLLVHFLVRPFYIPSGSMLPTLQIRDLLLVNKAIYDFTDPVRGDIVVFHTDTSIVGETPPLIKRVVGLEHDKVEVRDGKLILNDIELDEPFIQEEIMGDFGPELIRENHIFVMGDNRNNSKDSRYIGQIPLDRLVGRAEVIIFPPSSWTSFNFPR
jgi:signal peptidase I